MRTRVTRPRATCTLATSAALPGGGGAGGGAEMEAFVWPAFKVVAVEWLPPLLRASGHTMRASYAPSGALVPRFERGDPVDVFLSDSTAIDELIGRGKIVA